MPGHSNPEERSLAHETSHRRRTKGESSGDQKLKELRSTDERLEERAVLVGVGPSRPGLADTAQLDELARLALTAGADLLDRVWQLRPRAHPSTYLGSGKLAELAENCQELDATLVICDDDLSPAQVRNMEKVLDLRVIDRSELIIHIFVLHAGTKQSRLQVELAQLRYLAPRLKRMWTHLSRIAGAGGIGSRGPGEKQLEVDRRIIQKRIRDLTRRLREIEGRRERQAQSRQGLYRVALVGYTNAGKSTLMRSLSGREVLVADQLFATLDTRTRRWDVDSDLEVLLSDTVGFIDKLPHHLVASFHATLEEVRAADLLLHVADASDPDVVSRVKVVRDVLEQIGAAEIPQALVLNKVDLLPDPVQVTVLAEELGVQAVVSATSGQGLEDLADLVRDGAEAGHAVIDLVIPAADGKVLATVAREGRVLHREYDGSSCLLRARLPIHLAEKFGSYRRQ